MKHAYIFSVLVAVGCSKSKADRPAEVAAPKAVAPVAAAPAAVASAAPCSGESAKLEVWDTGTPVYEVLCEGGERRVRFSEFDAPVEATLTAAEWDRVWRAIDATGWQKLSTQCGKQGDDEGYTMTVTRNGKARVFPCDSQLSGAHLALRDVLYTIEGLAKRAPAAPVADGWTVSQRSVGPIQLGMTEAAMRALPGIELSDETVVDEGEELPVVHVKVDGRHELTLTMLDDKVSTIEIVGPRAQFEPAGKASKLAVGTPAVQLEALLGKPTSFQEAMNISPACAEFAKAPAVHFCFVTNATSWREIIKKKNALTSMLLVN